MTHLSDPGKDIFGTAFLDFLKGDHHGQIMVKTDLAEDEQLPVAYFFRGFNDMPEWEQLVLQKCKGRTLDVGAGAGSHTLYLQEKGIEVTALDISPGSVACMKKRGIKNAVNHDFYLWKAKPYDTLLFLMNGLGMAGKTDRLPAFFEKAKSLLAPGGTIYCESTDLLYLYTDEHGAAYIDLAGKYYGEIQYTLQYKNVVGEPFDWIFADFDNLQHYALQAGLSAELIYQGENHQYIAQLTHTA